MTTRTNGSAAWPTRTGIDPCSRDCLSCGPGKSARRDHRNPGPAGGDGRESCEPRLCRFGSETPRPAVERFADSPSWDYVASFRHRTDEFCTRPFRAATAIRGEQHAVLLLAQGFVKAKQCRRLQNDCV